jgi:hypothetical protein
MTEEKKDIIISIKNLPPKAYKAMSEWLVHVQADVMRKMGRLKGILSEDSCVNVSHQVSQPNENQNQ